MYDLNALIDERDPLRVQVHLVQASGINNQGYLIALGYYNSGPNNGQYEAFLLPPVRADATR